MTTSSVTLTDGPRLAEVFHQKDRVALVDSFKLPTANHLPKVARGIHLTQTIAVHPTSPVRWVWGRAITVGVTLRATPSGARHMRITLAQHMSWTATLRRAYQVELVQGFGAGTSFQLARALALSQQVRLASSFVARAAYHTSVRATLRLAASDALHHGGVIAVSLALHDIAARQYRGVAGIAAAVHVAGHPIYRMLFQIGLVGNLGVADQEVLRAIYRGDHLVDDICMFIYDLDPGGGLTTWAINTRTGAVTEYQNFGFNSMCRMGRRFLGASSSGLFELDGETDAGAAIVTHTRGGAMQLGGSRFTQFSAVYLGVRTKDNAADFFLKLIAGDGREFVYPVKVSDQQTTKVDIGKGLRARYITWELMTSGADFDLDSIEFVPIISQRRV